MTNNQENFVSDLQKVIQSLSEKYGCNVSSSVKENDDNLKVSLSVVFKPQRTDADLFDSDVVKGSSYINKMMSIYKTPVSKKVSLEALAKFSFKKGDKEYYFVSFSERNKNQPLMMLSNTGELINVGWSFFLDTKTIRVNS